MPKSLAEMYPQYYKAVPAGVDPSEIDTYVINKMFPVDDASGCVLHARKKLLIPGVRSGGKSLLKDVKEARDTLNRYIALHEPLENPVVEVEPVADGTVVDDGWITHSGNEVPFPLDHEDLTDVRLADGTIYEGNFAKPAHQWIWVDDGVHSRITHYRLSKIVQAVNAGPHLWIQHADSYMPDGLDPDEIVEVKLSNGHEMIMAKRADNWDWAYRQLDDQPDAAPHIVAWRRYRHQSC